MKWKVILLIYYMKWTHRQLDYSSVAEDADGGQIGHGEASFRFFLPLDLGK